MYGDTWVRREELVDLMAVERAMCPRWPCPELTTSEQQYAAREMTAAGWSAREIAARLGVTQRTVCRWRIEDG